MKARIQQLFGISEMAPASHSTATRFLILQLTRVASIQIVSTFLVLFLLDEITFEEMGIIFAIQLLVVGFLDYPTGALGDTIGHRQVLFIAYICYAFSILVLLFANDFDEFLLWGVLAGIGFSQESGALESWFDNNYHATVGDADPDRRVYGAFQGKTGAVLGFLSGSSFILGGIIATLSSRRMLFLFQLGMVCVVLLLILLLMTNVSSIAPPQRSFRAYWSQLAGGIRFAVSSRGIFFYLIGLSLIGAGAGAIWMNFLLFPYYDGYSGGSDDLTGLLRASIFLTGIGWTVIAMKASKKVQDPRYWIVLTSFLAAPVFFFLTFLYYEAFPPSNNLVLATYIGTFIVFQFLGFWMNLDQILRSRLHLEYVPDKYRNAVYSLIPTLIVLVGAPLIIIAGSIITNDGFSSGILFVVGLCLLGAILSSYGLIMLPKTASSSKNGSSNKIETDE